MNQTDFELLNVVAEEDVFHARLSFTYDLEGTPDYHPLVERDLKRLSDGGTLPVALDLTTVQHAGDVFIGRSSCLPTGCANRIDH